MILPIIATSQGLVTRLRRSFSEFKKKYIYILILILIASDDTCCFFKICIALDSKAPR